KTEGVVVLEGQVAVGGFEAVVHVGVAQAPVQYQIHLAARLRNPVQAAVDAHAFTDVVVLDAVAPGEVGCEVDQRSKRNLADREVALRQRDFVFGIARLEVVAGERLPGDAGATLETLTIVVITLADIEAAGELALATGGDARLGAGKGVVAHGDHHAAAAVRG